MFMIEPSHSPPRSTSEYLYFYPAPLPKLGPF